MVEIMASIFKLLICVLVSMSVGAFPQKKPNIVFILTDDQNTEMASRSAMPKLLSLVGDKGATFLNSFVPVPICCPSRSSIFSGQYVHNHGTAKNSIAGGCSSREWQDGPEKSAFPVLMQNRGYKTFFAGKYLNTYGNDAVGGVSHVPPGWTSWLGLKGNSVYYNYYLSVNGTPVYYGTDPEKDYLPKVINNEAVNFIDTYSDESPFFMMLSTPSIHYPFTPEPKYEHSFGNASLPKDPNFNIVNKNKNWFLQFGEQPLHENILDDIEEVYKERLRTLQSVDDMIESVVQSLESRGFLDNTYIFYTADNGYHLGQFSLVMDKREPYEFDIRVPLFVRGPGIPEGIQIDHATTNIDLSPTFLNIAGISVPEHIDGTSLKNVLLSPRSTLHPSERTFLIEYTGEGLELNTPGCEYLGSGFVYCLSQYDCKCLDARNNTYNCIRTLGHENNEIYCHWVDYKFEEYYNITEDKYEINNSIDFLSRARYNYLNKQLQYLLKCSGSNCNSITLNNL